MPHPLSDPPYHWIKHVLKLSDGASAGPNLLRPIPFEDDCHERAKYSTYINLDKPGLGREEQYHNVAAGYAVG